VDSGRVLSQLVIIKANPKPGKSVEDTKEDLGGEKSGGNILKGDKRRQAVSEREKKT